MATPLLFPSLRPAERRYDPGLFPVTVEAGSGSGDVRFLHGPANYGHRLELVFPDLNQSDAALIRAHYRACKGGNEFFSLSDEVWDGHSAADDILAAGGRWRYAEPIEEDHHRGGLVTVSVVLMALIF